MEIFHNLCKQTIEKDTNNYYSQKDSRDVVVYNDIEIDSLIFKSVLLLNEKGYETTNSCSGHTYCGGAPTTYVAFRIKNKQPPDISIYKDFFVYDKVIRDVIIIRYRGNIQSTQEGLTIINNTLYEMIKKLF